MRRKYYLVDDILKNVNLRRRSIAYIPCFFLTFVCSDVRRFYKNGEWQEVVTDTRIPCAHHSKSNVRASRPTCAPPDRQVATAAALFVDAGALANGAYKYYLTVDPVVALRYVSEG